MNHNRPKIVTASPSMRSVLDRIDILARRDCTVLLRGETGTGKELAARVIHAACDRRDQPFVPVDCTALPEQLVESQLFGHVAGAFTGAQHESLGFIRAADGGTLFLDEIGELPPAGQAKLLRCIQERVVTPVGSVTPIPVDIRIIAATHRDLAEMAHQEAFRDDLLYRLDVISIEMPALRERPEDVLPLVNHFLQQLGDRYDESVKKLSHEAAAVLQRFDWPGNVRQLSNAIEHAVVFCSGPVIKIDDLPQHISHPKTLDEDALRGITTLELAERQLIIRALRLTHGNQTQAARLIQVERHRLSRKIKQYDLEYLTHPSAYSG